MRGRVCRWWVGRYDDPWQPGLQWSPLSQVDSGRWEDGFCPELWSPRGSGHLWRLLVHQRGQDPGGGLGLEVVVVQSRPETLPRHHDTRCGKVTLRTDLSLSSCQSLSARPSSPAREFPCPSRPWPRSRSCGSPSSCLRPPSSSSAKLRRRSKRCCSTRWKVISGQAWGAFLPQWKHFVLGRN